MIKQLIILSLAGLVACALAGPAREEEPETQLALFEEDDVEVEQVKMKEFENFCVAARDQSKLFLNKELNQAALKVYNAIFKSIEKMGIEAVTAGNNKVEEGRHAILDEEFAKKLIAQAEEDDMLEPIRIDGEVPDSEEDKPVSKARIFFGSIAHVFRTVLQYVADETWSQIGRVRDELKGENFKVVFNEACVSITEKLEPLLKQKFQTEKQGLRNAATDKDQKLQLSLVTFDDVNCVTTKRIVLASRLCNAVKILGPVFSPFLDFYMEGRSA